MMARMNPHDPAHFEACYRALTARDARFDGCFFTGVSSTGIYCRPVCKVKAPKRENCSFFSLAAQAEQAGFRPCLRCRPELAPQLRLWSSQDANALLATAAARWLDEPQAWPLDGPSVAQLALRLGVSDRHVRRIFAAQWGVSPLQYLQTRRLLNAKQLLTDTDLPVTQVAWASGFASVRRFNAAFQTHYRMNPSQLRQAQRPRTASAATSPHSAGQSIRLGYRPPYDVAAMLDFWRRRMLHGVEHVSPSGIQRTLRIDIAGQTYCGWLWAEFTHPAAPAAAAATPPQAHANSPELQPLRDCNVQLRVSDGLREVLPQVIHRLRTALDLDANPQAINAVLHPHFPTGDGLRVPGGLDGFELAVRAVLGQQITVAAARTLAQRLVARFGTPLATPWPQLNRLFPTPEVLANASAEDLGSLGIVRQRHGAITALAQAVATQSIALHSGADIATTVAALKTLPGIGDWTAQYIAMRALRWPDAFAAGDVALHKALGLMAQPARPSARAAEAERQAQAWRPWRSYALVRAWAYGPPP